MPDILTFKEHDSSNFLVLESFTQFRGQLYAGLAEYLQTAVCSRRLVSPNAEVKLCGTPASLFEGPGFRSR